MKSDLLQIATIGKVVGLWGELKLHIQCDFEDQFANGEEFTLSTGKTIIIETFNTKKSLVKFLGYQTREDARKLTNQQLFTTKERTKKNYALEDGQFFWFDVVGSEVYDKDILLGVVDEVERISTVDYLIVKTSDVLVKKEYEKKFYIPYIDQYIKKFNLENKKIETNDALLLLEVI